jgi:hypothetical protein
MFDGAKTAARTAGKKSIRVEPEIIGGTSWFTGRGRVGRW